MLIDSLGMCNGERREYSQVARQRHLESISEFQLVVEATLSVTLVRLAGPSALGAPGELV